MRRIKLLGKYLYFKYYLRTPKRIISWLYSYVLGKKMNWDNPQDLNEKINWLKVYGDTSMWPLLADKYRVREYVRKKGLGELLVPLYGKWDSGSDVDFESLPSQFVIKTNHGSGEVLVVKDKSSINQDKVREDLNRWLKERYGFLQGEPHYLKIKPVIIAEKLLVEKNNSFSSSLVDYKVWCFNGKPYCIWACYSRTKEATYVGTYDLNWNYHPEWSVFTDHYKDGGPVVTKPQSFNEMIKAASILSEGFPQVRVDFYDVDGKLYFGEMTFTSNGGFMRFYTDEFLLQMGKQIHL